MADGLEKQSNDPKSDTITVNISTFTILKVVLVGLILIFFYSILDIVAMLFVAFILAAIIDPLADWCESKSIPRGIAVLIIYILFLAVLSLLIVLLVPPIIDELKQFVSNFGLYWGKLTQSFVVLREYTDKYGLMENFQKAVSGVEANLTRGVGSVFSTIAGFFGGIASFFIILVLAFYMVIEEGAIKRMLKVALPDRLIPYLSQIFNKVQLAIGSWVRGQLVLSCVIGILCYIGLRILGIEYALVLALFAAFVEFVPYVGPVIGAIPAIFLAFAQSPVKALFVVLLYLIIQQVENNILAPKIMQRAVGLNPIFSLISILIGAKIAGVFGALLAIPTAVAVSVFLRDFYRERNKLS